MDLWAGEARMGTPISINNGLAQAFFSHETKLQKKGEQEGRAGSCNQTHLTGH